MAAAVIKAHPEFLVIETQVFGKSLFFSRQAEELGHWIQLQVGFQQTSTILSELEQESGCMRTRDINDRPWNLKDEQILSARVAEGSSDFGYQLEAVAGQAESGGVDSKTLETAILENLQ